MGDPGWDSHSGWCTDTLVGAECRSVFVSPCLDSSRLDTASACEQLRRRRGGEKQCRPGAMRDVMSSFIYNRTGGPVVDARGHSSWD